MMKAAMLKRGVGFFYPTSVGNRNQRPHEAEAVAGRGLGRAGGATASSELLDESAVRRELEQVALVASTSTSWALRLPRRLARHGRGRRTEMPAAPAATLAERCLDMARRMATYIAPVVAVPLGVLLGWHMLDSHAMGWSEGRM